MTPSHKAVDVQEIPNGWNVKALGEIVSLYQPQTISAKQFTEAGYPVYGANGVVGNYHSANHETWQVTVTCRGSTCGTVNRTVDQCWITGNAMVLNCEQNSALNKEFLYQLMLGQDLSDCITGTGQPQIVRSPLAAFRVAFPATLEEQRAIATALSDVDALIAGLERLIAKKRDIKQAAMQQLLTGQTRLPGFSGEWQVKRLGEIARLYQPQTISQTEFNDYGYPVFGANGAIGMYERFNHDQPQITVSCRGNCGTVNRTNGPAWITGNAMVVNLDATPNVHKGFVYYALSFSDLSVLVTGSGIPQIVRGPLSEFAIELPTNAAEQSAIATVLSDMDADLSAVESRLAKTRAIKQGMMQELLTGRTRLI